MKSEPSAQSMSLHRVRLWLGILVVGIACAWALFATFMVPAVIERAYHGGGSGFLSSIITRLGKPLDDLLRRWSLVTQAGLVACLGFWLLSLATTSQTFFRRFVGEATPGSLGAIRMLTCAILLTSVIWEDLASSALLPREMVNASGAGVMKLLHLLPIGFDHFVANTSALQLFERLTAFVLFLGMIGWNTRLVIPLGAICYLVFGGILRQYAWFYHTGLVPLYMMIVLSFTPCGDGWSADRLWKVFKGQPVPPADRPSPVYGWSRYACWAAIALPYVAAGMSKLRNVGFSWWHATNLRAFLYKDSLNPMEFDWDGGLWLQQAPDGVFALLGFAGLFGEVTFGIVLFSRMARLILPAVMAMMHLGIWFLQNVLFFDLIPLQLVFYDFVAFRKAVGRWLAARSGSIQVLYDGWCPLCLRTVRLLKGFDLFERLRWSDFRQLDLADYNRRHGLSLSPQELETQMCVISQGRVARGFYGYRRIALALPAFWVIAPWLFVPGVSWIGERVYQFIAANRPQLLQCDPASACAPGATSLAALAASAESSPILMGPLAVSALIAVLALCWVYRVERYPFTAMQMYTKPTSEVVNYYKVLARRESGETVRADLEGAIRAVADGRYRKVIRLCFQPKKVHVCEKFLQACGAAHNLRAHPGERITHLTVQRWTWNFRADPSDPDYGNVAEQFVLALN